LLQSTISSYPPLRWLQPTENVFGISCLDVRGFTRTMKAYTTDPEIADAFMRFRMLDGKGYRGKSPEHAARFPCELCYPLPDHMQDTPVYKAVSMDEKWDIYLYDGYLYFCRSWTGVLIFRAKIELRRDCMAVIWVEANPAAGGGEAGYAVSIVDFLIKSHLLAVDSPVHIPCIPCNDPVLGFTSLVNETTEIAKYVFHEYGPMASFATYQDTTHIPYIYDKTEFLPKPFPLRNSDLKDRIRITDSRVECPVKNCQHSVPCQNFVLQNQPEFQCPDHKIFIAPSTFQYPNETDNLLWREPQDLELLEEIKTVKRESPIARDNSKDALTWNVFYYMQKTGLLKSLINSIHQSEQEDLDVYYWTYNPLSKQIYADLSTCAPNLHLQSDLIIRTESALYLIDAKFTASHNTIPENPNVGEGYTRWKSGWYQSVFTEDFHTVAIAHQKYELLRLWLMGSKLAEITDRSFYLITVGRQAQHQNIGKEFSPLVVQTPNRKFIPITWEDCYSFSCRFGPPVPDTYKLLAYLENKTTGYNPQGKLVKAFQL
jgi:hypothetical protein